MSEWQPTLKLRFIKRLLADGTTRRVLQQKWLLANFDEMGSLVSDMQEEWRDVPEVDDE